MNAKSLNFKKIIINDIESHILCCKKLMKNNLPALLNFRKSVKKIVVPSDRTSRIQEMHILIGHIICSLSEKKFLNKST